MAYLITEILSVSSDSKGRHLSLSEITKSRMKKMHMANALPLTRGGDCNVLEQGQWFSQSKRQTANKPAMSD